MKIKALYLHLLTFLWLVFLMLLLRFFHLNVTGLGMTLAVLTLIFLPGIWLYRLIKLETENLPVKMLYIIALGFCFYFFLNFLGIIFQLSLNQLCFAIGFLGIILLFLNLWEDRHSFWQADFTWFKKLSIGDWLLIALAVLGLVVAFISLNAQSDKILGDGWFHLAILRKVVSAENLNPFNLWITNTSSLNLVYSFPVWHIFLGFLSRILGLNIFATYTQVLLPLVILLILTSFGFLKIIFRNRYLTIVGFLAFLILSFSAGIFYNLIPLRSPDSLVRLLLFPLLLAITCNYLFTKSAKILVNVLLISFLAILMGLIHFTQLLDYCLILGVFAILYWPFTRDKEIYPKLGWLFLTLVGLILPYLLIFRIEALRQFVQGNISLFGLDNLPNQSYHNMGNIYLYLVFSLPLLVIFFKRERRLVFLGTVALVLMAVSWQFFHLRPFFLKYLGEIFTIRAITDIPGFAFLGFIIFLISLVLNYLLAKKKILLYLADSLLLIFLLAVVFWNPLRIPIVTFIDEAVFTPDNLFFYVYFVPILILFIAAGLVTCLYRRFVQKQDLSIGDPRDRLNFAIIIWVIFMILALPYFGGFKAKIAANPNGSLLANRENLYNGDSATIGGQKTLDFLNTLPSSSVLTIPSITAAELILIQKNVYLAEYPYGIKEFTYSQTLFKPETSLNERLAILNDNHINFVVCLKSEEEALFEADIHFEKIFTNQYTYQAGSGSKAYQKNAEFVVFKYSP